MNARYIRMSRGFDVAVDGVNEAGESTVTWFSDVPPCDIHYPDRWGSADSVQEGDLEDIIEDHYDSERWFGTPDKAVEYADKMGDI